MIESFIVNEPIDAWLASHLIHDKLSYEELHGVRTGMIVLALAWHNEYNEWLDPEMLYKFVNLRF